MNEKDFFLQKLKTFTSTLSNEISKDGEWTIRGFVDIFKNVYAISADTKVVSKILELHLFPHFLIFAKQTGFDIELADYQNWYPDLTFVSKKDPSIKFAVDIKTTYRDEKNPNFCNGFTLGSHGGYFSDRTGTKNIQYPYRQYGGHFILGIIYSREVQNLSDELKSYSVDEIKKIPPVIKNFIFFAEEKWKIAGDKEGSGNTGNIGSIKCIEDILAGRGVFSKADEKIFDDYWMNFGKITVSDNNGDKKKPTFAEYLRYRGLPETLDCPRRSKKAGASDE